MAVLVSDPILSSEYAKKNLSISGQVASLQRFIGHEGTKYVMGGHGVESNHVARHQEARERQR